MCSTKQRLAALLREQREAQGFTLRQASARAKLSPSTLSRWEAGACTPRVPELEGLLNALGVDPNDVLRILLSLDAPRAARAARSIAGDHSVAPSGGALLKALRRKANLSLSELADSIGVSQSTISRWETSANHPSPQATEALMDRLKASPEEKACFLATGVAKIKVDRPDFEPQHYAKTLDELEWLMWYLGGGNCSSDNLELRYLQLQTVLWWSANEPLAAQLLQRAYVSYGEYLVAWQRHDEALAQAELALDSLGEIVNELYVRAKRVIARADMYRWPVPRPHLALLTLQQTLVKAPNEETRAGLLADMADASRISGRTTEGLSYAERAVAASKASNDEEAKWTALGAYASSLATLCRIDEAMSILRSDEAPLHIQALFGIRAAEILRNYERFEAARSALLRVKEFAERGVARHLARVASSMSEAFPPSSVKIA
jgi:transcriptional regulator with XRE-family HTH domain